jgi:hypothetical protein
MGAAWRTLALLVLLSAARPVARAAVGDRLDAHRIAKHNLQPYLPRYSARAELFLVEHRSLLHWKPVLFVC